MRKRYPKYIPMKKVKSPIPEHCITHKGCPRCSGTQRIGLGSREMACQYYGYNKQHGD